jgi:hypothetical protein
MLLLTLKRHDFVHIFCSWKTVLNLVWIRLVLNWIRIRNRYRQMFQSRNELNRYGSTKQFSYVKCWGQCTRTVVFLFYNFKEFTFYWENVLGTESTGWILLHGQRDSGRSTGSLCGEQVGGTHRSPPSTIWHSHPDPKLFTLADLDPEFIPNPK